MLSAVTVSARGWARDLAADARDLATDRGALDRGSTAERVADLLRQRVTDGVLAPGTRLSEEALTGALGVSRNTLREAFRLLTHEGLLVHELNRGVFVRVLTVEDVVDLYRVRRIIELAAVQSAAGGARADVRTAALEPLRAAVDAADSAAAADDWVAVGTHNMRFHQALAALAGSTRVDEIMRRVLAELRLVFHAVRAPRDLHEPYLRHNRELYQLLAAGQTITAAAALSAYLDAAERRLIDAYVAHRPGP
jgi:DNA-binding GntR family transcriptional regulator